MNDAPDTTAAALAGQRVRWWPAVLILLLAAGAWYDIWYFEDLDRQHRYMRTAPVLFGALLLSLVWVLFFSRLAWRWRWLVLGSVVAASVALAALFHIRGVTGDLLPVLEWRWKKSGMAGSRKPEATAVLPQPVLAATNDYPQFLGPHRTAKVSVPALAHDWKIQPPALIWRQPIGTAWSGFVVRGALAITQEQRGEQEMVVCYELTTGREKWTHGESAHYHTTIAGEGPRATPTLAGERVFAMGATGILICLEAATGKLVWRKEMLGENQAALPTWGLSGSPLVVDNLVVVSIGGKPGRSLVAYQQANGERVWTGGNDDAGYSSPCLVSLAGTPQILIFNANQLTAHDKATGKVLWEFPWPAGHPHVAVPVVLPGDQVLISSGYGTGSSLLQIARSADGAFSARQLWKSNRLKAKFTNVVNHHGYVYGLDDGILVCIDAADGQLKWKEGRYGHGQVILANDLLLVMAENGEVVLLDPVPQESRELSRFAALKGKTWNPPALAGAWLLVRNDIEAACYRLPVVNP